MYAKENVTILQNQMCGANSLMITSGALRQTVQLYMHVNPRAKLKDLTLVDGDCYCRCCWNGCCFCLAKASWKHRNLVKGGTTSGNLNAPKKY
jgi:hypothetical protein